MRLQRATGGFSAAPTREVTTENVWQTIRQLPKNPSKKDPVVPKTVYFEGEKHTLTKSKLAGRIKHITKQSRQPNLPLDEFKVIIRLQNTSKGVIKGIALEYTQKDLNDLIVKDRNPSVVAAKCMGNTKNVIVLFSGLKVPRLVRFGASTQRSGGKPSKKRAAETIAGAEDICNTQVDEIASQVTAALMPETENVFLELVPLDNREDKLFILNLCSHGVFLRRANENDWETTMASSDLNIQLNIINAALEATSVHGTKVNSNA
ncbi:hypothetical protein HPB49_023576 [Dermacentor silvarum]|uniref:Uncharacterized protein n=1 Tax=Dermacentor silvarum TaxID=543639 RepID=A0ACB8D8L3_DERSI|nr:hypothetical protein HPB49_023576 [Dermacentor silvarum]